MTNVPQVGDGAHALWRAVVLSAINGTYAESGLDAGPGASGSAIQSDVDGGTVRFADAGTVDVAPDTLTHNPVRTADNYRMDVIYATRQGTLAIAEGQAGQPAPTTDGSTAYPEGGTPQEPRRLFWPAPPDGSTFAGLPLWVVVVADTTSDSTGLSTADYIDYRVPSAASDVDTTQFALNRRTYGLESTAGELFKLATVNDGTGGFAGAQVRVFSANAVTNLDARSLEAGIVTRNSGWDVRAREHGTANGSVDLVVSEQGTNSTGTTENKYHLYARVPSNTDAYAVVEHVGTSWGNGDLVVGLGANDILGTVVSDTGDPQTGRLRRAVAAVADTASQGDVPIFGTSGEATWKKRTHTSGELKPLVSYRFGVNMLQMTGDTATRLSKAEEDVVVPFGQLKDPMYEDDLYGSITAGISADNGPAEAAVLFGVRATKIDNTAATSIGTDMTPVAGPPQAIAEDGPATINVYGYRSKGVGAIYISRPAVTIWGKVK